MFIRVFVVGLPRVARVQATVATAAQSFQPIEQYVTFGGDVISRQMRYRIEHNKQYDQQKENGRATQRYVRQHAKIDEHRTAHPLYFGQPNDADHTPHQFNDGQSGPHIKKLDHVTTRLSVGDGAFGAYVDDKKLRHQYKRDEHKKANEIDME